jgi:threonine/homoserine/homoserine lactone efflux protein
MTWTLFAGLIAFSVVSAFTPGPNNLMALASGANFGYRRTLPHILGVCLGFSVMLALVGAGLGKLFEALPAAYTILKFAALGYLMFLAWKIATSGHIGEGREAEDPITLLGSAMFQWVNPKAWIASITIVTSFTNPAAFWPSLSVGGAANIVLCFSAVSSWALFGTIVKSWLSNPVRLRIFNWSMAALLVLSVIPSLFH